MPMGIVSDDELEVELKRNGAATPRPGTNGNGTPKTSGRIEGDVNVPEVLRKIIGEEMIENGRASAIDLASSFGISSSSVSAYARGATSTASYNNPSGELKKHIRSVKDRIAGKAKKRLGWALNGITEEKLNEASLKVAASVAKDMAVIIKQMEPDDSASGRSTNVQVVLFAPPPMSENDFPVLRVRE